MCELIDTDVVSLGFQFERVYGRLSACTQLSK